MSQGTAQLAFNPAVLDKLFRLNANLATSNTTLASSNLAFPIAPNEVWLVECQITAQCSSSGGLKYAIAAPTGAVVEGWLYSSGATPTTPIYQRINAINTASTTAIHTAVSATPSPDMIIFTIANGATAGTLALQAASITAGQTSTFFAGSYLHARKLVNV